MLSSWVWKHCQRSEDGLEATCQICDVVLHIKGSTSSLNKHLRVVHGMMGDEIAENGSERKRRFRKLHIFIFILYIIMLRDFYSRNGDFDSNLYNFIRVKRQTDIVIFCTFFSFQSYQRHAR